MTIYNINKKFNWTPTRTERTVLLMRMYGITEDNINRHLTKYKCTVEIEQGDIVYITGPSGCGKSLMMKELENQMVNSDKINIDQIELCSDKAVIDCLGSDFLKAFGPISIAGLCECFCMLTKPSDLSEGQKYRYKLAKLLDSGKKIIFADEFCTNLDTLTAGAISHKIKRLSVTDKKTFILASNRMDILPDLLPDVLIKMDFSGKCEPIYMSMDRQLKMERHLKYA
jgi:ABC-type ATPase with predicted acetyltransferase domain